VPALSYLALFDGQGPGHGEAQTCHIRQPDAGRAVGVVRGRPRAGRGCPALLGERPAGRPGSLTGPPGRVGSARRQLVRPRRVRRRRRRPGRAGRGVGGRRAPLIGWLMRGQRSRRSGETSGVTHWRMSASPARSSTETGPSNQLTRSPASRSATRTACPGGIATVGVQVELGVISDLLPGGPHSARSRAPRVPPTPPACPWAGTSRWP